MKWPTYIAWLCGLAAGQIVAAGSHSIWRAALVVTAAYLIAAAAAALTDRLMLTTPHSGAGE